jgi:hypothetical protein
MPNLDFYAAEGDRLDVLRAVFRLGCFRVFEAYSRPDHELREFFGADEVPAEPSGYQLMLYAVGAGPEPVVQRIVLRPSTAGGASFRFRCWGWGLVQLSFGGLRADRLESSHTNHNTPKRAASRAHAYPELGDPELWDWAAVTNASRRLNRAIRALAVDKVGSRPVLPFAAEFVSSAVRPGGPSGGG